MAPTGIKREVIFARLLSNVAGHNKSLQFFGSYVGNYDAVFYHNTDCSGYLARYGSDSSGIGSGLYDQFYSMRIERHQIDGLMICSATNMSGTCATFQYVSDSTCMGLGNVAGHNRALDFLGTYDSNYDAIMYHDTGCNTYLARYGQDNFDIGYGLYDQFYSMRLERHKAPGRLTLVEPAMFTLSTTNAQVGQYITTGFGIQNIGESAITIQNLATAVRYGTSWDAPIRDYPSITNITLQPGGTYFYSAQRSFTEPGGYFAQPVAQVNGVWATVPDSYPINFTVSNPPSPTQSDQQSMTIYDESLITGWDNYSWNSSVNFADTGRPYSASKAIFWQPNAAYAGFYLHTNTPVNTSGYATLTFAMKGTWSGQTYGVTVYDANGNSTGSLVTLANYGGDPPTNHYRLYAIPLSAFGAVNTQISGFHIQDLSGSSTPAAAYIDRIMLGGNAGDPWVNLPANKLLAYDDNLASGWQSWSWNSSLNWTGGPAYTGNNSLIWTPTAGWAGLDIHNPSGVSTSSYTTIHFAIKATQPGQQLVVFLDGANGSPIGTSLFLADYGADPVTGWWKRYDIPLQDFGLSSGQVITGIVIQNNTPNATPNVYVDEVGMY